MSNSSSRSPSPSTSVPAAQLVDTSSHLPKRTVVTYGRAKPAAESDAVPLASRETTASARANSPNTRRVSSSDDSEDGKGRSTLAPKSRRGSSPHRYQSDWRLRLKEIDDKYDEAEDPSTASTSNHWPADIPRPKAESAVAPRPRISTNAVTRTQSQVDTSSPLSSQKDETSFGSSLLDNSLSSITDNLGKPHRESPPTSPSEESPDPASVRLVGQRNSPGVSKSTGAEGTKKAKKKAKTTSVDQPNHSSKNKKPTKKEREAAARATARIRSDERVSLGREDVQPRLPMSQLLSKFGSNVNSLQHAQEGRTRGGSSGGVLSDPITDYSSSPSKALRPAAVPRFHPDARKVAMAPKHLNALLLDRSQQQGRQIRKKKEEEFVQLGGKLKTVSDQDIATASTEEQKTVEEDGGSMHLDDHGQDRSLETLDEDEAAASTSEEDEAFQGSDEDELGQLSEEELPISPSRRSVTADAENEVYTGASTMRRMGTLTLEDSFDSVEPAAPRRRAQRSRAIHSDDDEDMSSSLKPQILVPDTSFVLAADSRLESPQSSASESERDKENSEYRAFDHSDNKENLAAPRHVPTGRVFEFRSDGTARALSISPPSNDNGADVDKENRSQGGRLPLASMRDSSTPAFTRRASQGSISQRAVLGVLDEDTSLDSPIPSPDGRAQMFAKPTSLHATWKADDGGFSQFFEPDDVSPQATSSFRPIVQPPAGDFLNALRKSSSQMPFSSTLPVLRDMKITETQRRKDDEVFGADFMADASGQTPVAPKSTEWFVNDKGLMTQTRPVYASTQPFSSVSESPLFTTQQSTLVGGTTQSSMLEPSIELSALPTTQRKARYSFSQRSSPDASPLQRLRRGPAPDSESDQEAPRPSALKAAPGQPPNAFDVMRAAAGSHALKRKKKRLQSEFVEGEAQESDDELNMTFGGTRQPEDDEVDDEDNDAPVEGLVDDAPMDLEAIAEHRVLEKHREHMEAEDAAVQKLHEQAAAGQLRIKRRDRGIGYEDSDSENEDIRRPKHYDKKRKIEGDTLPQLANNPDTRAFFNAYQDGLPKDDEIVLPPMDEIPEKDQVDRPAFDEVSSHRLRDELRQAAKSRQPIVALDPEDAGWAIASQDDDHGATFRELPKGFTFSERAARSRQRQEHSVASLQRYRTEEGQARGSSVRGMAAAVTGHKASRASSVSGAHGAQVDSHKATRSSQGRLGTILAKRYGSQS